ncbi:MAG: Panacea domain-containing protein, partial [Acidimicrobiales bacterium]
MAPVSAHDVARELRGRLPGLGAVGLHKLLYYCQGWHLAHTGRVLFSEPVEAWANGPVVASLWRCEAHEDRPRPERRILEPEALATVGYVVSRYGNLTPQQLIDLTHEEDPWRDVSLSNDESFDQRITVEDMQLFFESE